MLRLLLATALSSALVYLFILMVDPYDSVPWSPDWERRATTNHNRYHTAALAKQAQFDSAVVGSSTSMQLNPNELDAVLQARFVNLAMQAASPYEQLKTLALFERHHPGLRYLVMGLDGIWCRPAGAPRFVGASEAKDFPEWLYDDTRWNDWPPFNGTVLRHARRQFEAITGVRIKYPRRADGFLDISQKLYKGKNSLNEAKQRIYTLKPQGLGPAARPTMPAYPDITALALALQALPVKAKKLLFFSPYHAAHLPPVDSPDHAYWQGCKRSVVERLSGIDGLSVVDLNFRSPISCADNNFLDGQHYRRSVATTLATVLGTLADPDRALPADRAHALIRAGHSVPLVEGTRELSECITAPG